MKNRFGFIPIISQFNPEGEAFNHMLESFSRSLEQVGGEEWSEKDIENPLPLLYFIITGGTEELLLKLRAERSKSASQEPVFILAHPSYNSLPASLEVLARLQQDHEQGRIIYLKGSDDKTGLDKLEIAVHDMEVSLALKQARIGLIGRPSDWLVASNPNLEVLQKTWGPEIIPVDIDELMASIKDVPPEATDSIRDLLTAGAQEVREPSHADLSEAVKVYLSLKQTIEQNKLDAITVRCFDLVLRLETTGCFGLSQLTDEGIISGCEGDLVSTLGLLWVKLLLEETPWMANPAQLDETENTLWLAHCTVPRCSVQSYSLRSHFESGLGVGIQGVFANGPVTLLRLGGTTLNVIWLAEGEIFQAGKAEDLCRTQAKVRLTSGNVNDLLQGPLGNHLIMVSGHHADRLKDWWNIMLSH